ncbi:Transcriptional regulator, TetR family [Microbacterium esteraromaticum]|uniref:Transcriptional regulator, TetR family n=1 Tax=Microbacterium esteraromaticum TaxID=57043 RepID=A0A1R4KQE6_9MICO|nr:TetR family transcriptional regulator [Microbacterium esteraromaticum]SJN46347.1 Transcriptional regulator, TetR family [Microbacterium esteraromaticum]
MTDQVRRRRDPHARRQAIVTAAAELITEVGVDAITHRMVAARADVPLGATTQYFATLDDLRDAALHLLVEHVDEKMNAIKTVLTERGTTPAVLAGLLQVALADARSVQADRAVVTAAVHDPRLRELARHWSDEFAAFLAPLYGHDRAQAAAVFIDGVLWHAQIHDEPLAQHLIESALTGILTPPPAAHTRATADH